MTDRSPLAVPSRRERGRALVAAVVGVCGSFAVYGPTFDFVVTPVVSLVVDLTPGVVVVAAIRLLGTDSERLAFVAGAALTVSLLWTGALVGIRAGRLTGDRAGPPLGVYFAGWGVAAVLTRSPFASLAAAVPMAAAVGAFEFRVPPTTGADRSGTGSTTGATDRSDEGRADGEVDGPADGPADGTDDWRSGRRRRVLRAAGVVGLAGVSYAVGVRRTGVGSGPLSAIPAREREAIEASLRDARRRSLDLAGAPGLVSTVEGFYEVDVDPVNPDVNVGGWELSVTGAVEDERTVTYGDLTALAPEHRFETLRCVGDPVDGHLMDTALWTGVPAAAILDRAAPLATGTHVMVRAVDGYYEEFPLEALRTGFLAYGMNGRVLPRKHGYPVRVLVPGHWGEINVKWVTGIEVLEGERRGYWEKRGWHGTGPVNTVAKLWSVERRDDRIRVGGHAYAGTRGIDAVEVSVDGGGTWRRARLGAALPDPDVWRQWTYEWAPSRDRHEVVVRAVDGTGDRQPKAESQPYPSGATGWARRTVRR